MRNVYPKAFGANLVNDVSAATLATYTPQLTASVENGDILMGHADYWQENDPTLASIYAAAGVTAPATSLSTPTLTWSTPTSISFGTPLSASQLDATANVPGVFTYSPATEAVLSAGTHVIAVTFTPTNTSAYRTASASVQLTVGQASPTVSWNTPAGIATGTALSSAQLNATASVPGVFTYQPAAGTVLGSGNNVLSVTFTPTDSVDYKAVTATTILTVSSLMTPTLTWSTPGAIVYGTVLSAQQLDATANVAGIFSYSSPIGIVLHAGNNILSVTFKPGSAAYASATKTVKLTVQKATPTITWLTPAAMSGGTPLSSAQLDATASVPGTFTYTPAADSVLNAGTNSLIALFTPADLVDYAATSGSVYVTVNSPAASVGPVVLQSPGVGSTVAGNVVVTARINVNLDAAGSMLLVDGVAVQGTRVTSAPFAYPLHTSHP